MTTATLNLHYRVIRRKIFPIHFIKIHWKSIYFLAVLFSSIMLVFYIFKVNELTQGAYVIKNDNKEISNLLQENKNLEANFAEIGFLGKVNEKAKELSFEKITEVTYVQILQNSLAEAN